MALLDMITDAAGDIGLAIPTTVMASSIQQVINLRSLANSVGRDLAQRAPWTELQRQYLFSTVASQDNYALPDDYAFITNDTEWNRTTRMPMGGPMSPQDWQAEKSGLLIAAIDTRFRIWQGRLWLTPTPTAVVSLVYEYTTNRWCKPVGWVTATAYAAGATVSYLNNRYTTVAGGTSGATAPTHISGSASDGGVIWVYADQGYTRWQADTDVGILDEDLMKQGLVYRYKESKGLPWAKAEREYENAVARRIGRDGGAQVLNMGGPTPLRRPVAVVPEGNWNL